MSAAVTATLSVCLGLAAILLLVVTYLAIMGLLAVFSGARFERCERCHRHRLTTEGPVHRGDCPDGLREHVLHLTHSVHEAVGQRARRHQTVG